MTRRSTKHDHRTRTIRLIGCWLLLSLLTAARPAFSQTSQGTGVFVITSLYISGANNLNFRINGTPTIAACPQSPNWAYVDEADSGSKEKVAALLAAYLAGKSVNVLVVPVNYYGDGQFFCHITDVLSIGG